VARPGDVAHGDLANGDSARGDAPVRVPKREMKGIWRLLRATVIPFVWVLASTRREGTHNVPREGPFVLAPNHTSNIDPIIVGVALFKAGRTPHFLGKISLFRMPLLGALLRSAGQIPIERGAQRSGNPLADAMQAAVRGDAIVVYPEGSLTRDPQIWPMRGKTGAVRLAIAAGIPLVPAAHWGTEQLLPPYARFLRLIPRKTIRIRFGEPVDLSQFAGKPLDARTLSLATDLVMAAITGIVEDLRGETAPAKRWDPTEHNQSEFGHP
jgi:1-acyl-sn-glycerol-3-phosphate acyltransferase